MIESWFSSPVYTEDNVDTDNVKLYEKEVKKWNPVVVHIFDIQYRYILRFKKRKLKDGS